MTTAFPRRPTRFARFKYWLTGVDADLLAGCPARDQDCVSMTFWLQAAVWLWLTVIFSAVVHLMLAPSGQWRPELIGVAVLLATIVTLIDSYMLIRTSWHLHGIAELTRAGLTLPGRWLMQVKFALFGLIRATQAVGSSVLIALFIGLLLYAKDIGTKLDQAYQQTNQALFESAVARENATLAQLTQKRAQASDLVIKAANDAGLLRRSGPELSQEDPEFRPTAERLTRLDNARVTADAALAKAQTAYGRDLRALSRRRGPEVTVARQEAEKRLTAARQRATAAKRDYEEARTYLASLRQQQQVAADRTDARQGVRLKEAETSQQQLRDRLAEIDRELEQRSAGREAAIRRSVESDPAHIRRDDGLLARARALHKLVADPWIATVVIVLDLFFFTVELAAVVGKTMSFVPSEYATELAKADYRRAHDAARELADHINGTAAKPPASPPTAELESRDPEPAPAPAPASSQSPDPDAASDPDLSGLTSTLQHAARMARQRAAKAAGPDTKAPAPPDERSTGARAGTETPRRRGRPPGSRNGHAAVPPDTQMSDAG